MNDEIARIRKERNIDDINNFKIKRVNSDLQMELMYKLNSNMTELFSLKNNNDVTVDDYIEKYIENIYIILDMFSEMNVYPDYYFNCVLEMNANFQKYALKYPNFKSFEIIDKFNSEYHSIDIYEQIRNGIHKEYFNKIEDNDIGQVFINMVKYYQQFNIPYGNKTIKQCKESFMSHYMNIIDIMSKFCNGMDEIDDIYCMSNLLFEYLSFFVEIGVNPKDYLNDYIDNKLKGKSK